MRDVPASLAVDDFGSQFEAPVDRCRILMGGLPGLVGAMLLIVVSFIAARLLRSLAAGFGRTLLIVGKVRT